MMLSLSFRRVVYWFTIHTYIHNTLCLFIYSHTTSVIPCAASCFIHHISTAFSVFCTLLHVHLVCTNKL